MSPQRQPDGVTRAGLLLPTAICSLVSGGAVLALVLTAGASLGAPSRRPSAIVAADVPASAPDAGLPAGVVTRPGPPGVVAVPVTGSAAGSVGPAVSRSLVVPVLAPATTDQATSRPTRHTVDASAPLSTKSTHRPTDPLEDGTPDPSVAAGSTDGVVDWSTGFPSPTGTEETSGTGEPTGGTPSTTTTSPRKHTTAPPTGQVKIPPPPSGEVREHGGKGGGTVTLPGRRPGPSASTPAAVGAGSGPGACNPSSPHPSATDAAGSARPGGPAGPQGHRAGRFDRRGKAGHPQPRAPRHHGVVAPPLHVGSAVLSA